MKNLIIAAAIFVLVGVIWWLRAAPSPESIASQMQIKTKEIKYNGETYAAEWAEDPVEFEGVARFLKAQFNPYAPFNTHVLIVATGHYANPDFLEIKADGKILMHTDAMPKGDPKGNFDVLHLVPQDKAMLKKIERTEVGKTVHVQGRLETDGRVTNTQGDYIQFDQKEGRKLILLDAYELK